MKYYVRWGFTDDIGRLPRGYCYIDWFETEELANQFIQDKRKGSGSYFQYKPPRRADYSRYIHYNELLKQVNAMSKEFE